MPVHPNELAVGRRVLYRGCMCGTITALDVLFETQAICTVRWMSDGNLDLQYSMRVICEECSLLCRNCGLPQEDHADGGKCLYGPASWAA